MMSTDVSDSKLKMFGSANSEPPKKPPAGAILSLSYEDVVNPFLHYPIHDSNAAKRVFRGFCLLINQKEFLPSTGHSRRDGTDVDADRVERLFKRLGYQVQRHLNMRQLDLHRIISEIAATDHKRFDSFVCFILTHGADGVVFAADGPVPVDAIVSRFRGARAPSLVGKPKLFFIQACRGSEFDRGVAIPITTDAVGDVIVTKLPAEADILIAQSTVPGYFAWRNSLSGSWFIQELCRALEDDFEQKSAHDLNCILTVVARCVAYQYRSKTGVADSHDMAQMTTFSSTLTRLMYLSGKPPVL